MRFKLIRTNYTPFELFYNTNDININTNNHKQSQEINDVIKKAGFKPEEDTTPAQNSFVRPNADDECSIFHKTNADGIGNAYDTTSGVYIQDNK